MSNGTPTNTRGGCRVSSSCGRCGWRRWRADHSNTPARELRDAHFDLKITPEVFDAVHEELGKTLDHFNVPAAEKEEVLGAFDAWKGEVTAGSQAGAVNWRRWQ
jgi:hypothetical protein